MIMGHGGFGVINFMTIGTRLPAIWTVPISCCNSGPSSPFISGVLYGLFFNEFMECVACSGCRVCDPMNISSRLNSHKPESQQGPEIMISGGGNNTNPSLHFQ